VQAFNEQGVQVLAKQRHEARIHGMLVLGDMLWTSAEDNKIVVSKATPPFADVCTLAQHTAIIRALTLVTYNGETRVWSGDVAGNVLIWDPLVLDWEHVGVQSPVIVPCTALPVTPKELEGLGCICQVQDSVWLGTRKAIIIFDLKVPHRARIACHPPI
jgi:hypothetical protein